MEGKTILIRARVVSQQGDVLNCRLVDGFAEAAVPVHAYEVIHLYDGPVPMPTL